MKTAARLLAYLRPFWLLQLVGVLCSFAYSISQLAFPWLEKRLIDDVFLAHASHLLPSIVLLFILAAAGCYVFALGQVYFYRAASERASRALQLAAYTHLQRLRFAFFDCHTTGEIMATFTSDIPTAATGFRLLAGDFLLQTVRLTITFLIILWLDWYISLVALILLLVYWSVPTLLKKPLQQVAHRVQSEKAALSSRLQESISGSRELKALAREYADLHTFSLCLGRLVSANVTQAFVTQLGSISIVLFWIATSLIFLVGAPRVFGGELSFGELFAVSRYFTYLYQPIDALVQAYNQWQSSHVAAERVFEFFDAHEPESLDPHSSPCEITGEVAFAGVRFGYSSDRPVLKDVTFTARPGDVVAVVGHSGAGKSTLVSLIPRFYEAQSGAILIDGKPISSIDLRSLRSQIGIVFQEPFLFADTVENNIRMGARHPDAVTPAEIVRAARAANADQFIASLPLGYSTVIGERGVQLSGGQRQRIAIARALVGEPKILILDEATSALDSESEALVQEALDRLMQGRTCLIIAHRLSTILKASCILVLHQGEILQMGTHKELLREQGVYSELFERQFSSPIRAYDRL